MGKTPLASTSRADNAGKYGTDSTNASDGGPPASRTLAAAVAFLRGSIRTDGAHEEIPEWEFAEYQCGASVVGVMRQGELLLVIAS